MIERPLAPADDAEARPIVPRRAAQTMIERPLAPAEDREARTIPPRRASKTMIERPLAPAEPNADAALTDIGTAEAGGAPRPIPAQAWIAIGAGAAATLVGLVFAVMWLIPRDITSRPTPASSSNSPELAVAPPQKPVAPPEASTETGPKRVETAQNQTAAKSDLATPSPGGDNRSEAQPSASDGGLAGTDPAEKETAPSAATLTRAPGRGRQYPRAKAGCRPDRAERSLTPRT